MGFDRAFSRQGLTNSISASAMALALVVASPAHAQSDTATLQGHVDGAAAGAKVVATDTYTGQKAVGTVNADGDYEIFGLRPSTYKVEVEGKASQQTTLLVGQTGVVDFGDSGREIVVSGRVLREVRTQTVSTNVTPAQIENLPQNSRNFLSFAILAPGVNVAPGGVAQLQAGAVSASNTNVLLDGMTMKNPINHGGVFGQNFGMGNPFPQSAIQEYKIETQNFGAEVGQTGSAVITAITKTGGDEFHGSAFIEMQPRPFIEQPYFDKKNGVTKPEYNRNQFGGELGGPIIPGKLNFYLAGEGTISALPSATGRNIANIPSALASQIATSHNKDFKQGLYFGKLTYYAGDADTINLSAFIRRENNLSDINDNATASHGRTILTHQDRYQLQWKHSLGDLLNTLNISYDKATQSTPSVGTGSEYIISAARNTFDELALTGAHFFEQGDNQKSITFRDDLTLRKGAHTLKAGVQVAAMDLSRTVNNSFNGRYYYQTPGSTGSFDPATSIPYAAKINIQPTPTLKAKDTQIGLYLQDEWKPDNHWTFNFGLRWDLETNANNNKYVTPAAIATALRNYPGWKAAGINPEDYISTGSNRKPQWDAFQPRFGFSYDVNGDRDLVIFGGAGRYYDRSLFIEGAIEQLTNSERIPTVFFCPTGTPQAVGAKGTSASDCLTWSSTYRDPNVLRGIATATGNGGNVFVLNNKTRLPYSDQFNIGVRKRFGGIQAELTLSHIRSHNIFMFERANYFENGWYTRFVTRTPIVNDVNGNYVSGGVVTGCTNGGKNWIQDNSPGGLTNADGSPVSSAICAAQNAQLSGFSGKLNRGVNGGSAHYTALYFKLDKPFTDTSKWGFTTALTVQWAKSNVAQELNSDEFWNGASQTGFGYQTVNSLEDWRLVTTGNYRAPWGVTLSGTLVLSSGPSFGSVQAPWNGGPAAPDGACCYGNFGGVYTPKAFIGYKRFDLRIAKTIKLPFEGHEITVDFQAFNLFNWLNRNYSSWGAGGGVPAPLTEDSQVGNDARSFQAGIKYKF